MDKTSEKMNRISKQYADSSNFMARVELNRRFGTNPYRWNQWVFDIIKFQENARILELGCGNALLWKSNLNRIPQYVDIVLSDFSEGMLNDAGRILGKASGRFDYEIIDAQEIPYAHESFDIVIANFMLYHVPDRNKAISEISRVLKNEGTFYATAFGIQNMKELTDIVRDFNNKIYDPLQSLARAFGLENGKKQLLKYFEDVKIMKYSNYLEVTEAIPMVNFILSSSNVIGYDEIEDFSRYIDEIIQYNGKIKITKDS
ncbi:MAG: class I SAM-dependent methyltransferase [Methanobacterium sp.]